MEEKRGTKRSWWWIFIFIQWCFYTTTISVWFSTATKFSVGGFFLLVAIAYVGTRRSLRGDPSGGSFF
jgi:hypothetical protein